MGVGGLVVGTGVGALVVVLAFVKFLLSERSGQKTLQERCDKLEKHVAELEDRVDEINGLYQAERAAKHDALQDVTKAVAAAWTIVSVVQRAEPCNAECHALDTVLAITPTITDVVTRLKEKHP